MFRFEYNFVLYALLLIPIFTAIYLFLQYKKRKNLASFGELRLIKLLMSDFSPTMQHLKFTLFMLAIALLILTIANPQTGTSLEKTKRKGVDIMLCVDVSNSMLAEDIKPNRMEAAKMGISRFIDQLKGDRIGMVVFAGNAFVQLPITSDYAAAKMFVNHIHTDLIPEQGTDLAAALDLAAVSILPDDPTNLDKNRLSSLTSKVILLISDGEDHFQDAIDVTQKIRQFGVTVHTIGIGSTRGEPIPVKSRKGNQGFKKDKEGNTVITRLNETMLRDIAAAGNGVYVHASNANLGFETIREKINAMHKTDLEEITFAKYESQFQIPLFLALFILFIEMLLFTTHSKFKYWLLQKHQSFKMKSLLLILPFSILPHFLQAQTKEELSAIRKGNREFFQAEEARKEAINLQQDKREMNQHQAPNKFKSALENYTKAEIDYRKAMNQTPEYDKANYNLGTALYRQEKYDEASSYFAKIAENDKSSKNLRAKSYHNLGNSLMKQEKYKESIDAYKNALKLYPSDMDTKYNLEYAKKKLMQQQQQQQQQQNQDKQNQDKQQQQNQDKQEQNQDKQEQDQQEQNSQEQQNKELQKQEQQQNKEKKEMDKRQLDALQQNERKTQAKVQEKEMQRAQKKSQEKDW